MARYYIVPLVLYTGSAPMGQGKLYPKYFVGSGVAFGSMRYGLENTVLVYADVTEAQHAQLAAQADVIALPADIDNTISPSALPIVQTALEQLKFPADWVTTSHTYRIVLRYTANAMQVAQKVKGIILHSGQPVESQRLFPAGVTLDTQFQELSDNIRSALIIAANYWQLDYSDMTPAAPLRLILKRFAEQIPPPEIMGVTI